MLGSPATELEGDASVEFHILDGAEPPTPRPSCSWTGTVAAASFPDHVEWSTPRLHHRQRHRGTRAAHRFRRPRGEAPWTGWAGRAPRSTTPRSSIRSGVKRSTTRLTGLPNRARSWIASSRCWSEPIETSADCGVLHRPGQLQDGQRHLGPRRGRQAAEGGRDPPVGGDPGQRHGRTSRWRRVRRARRRIVTRWWTRAGRRPGSSMSCWSRSSWPASRACR